MHCVRKKTLNLLRFWQRHSDRCIRIILLCVPMLIRTYVSKEDVCGDDHVRVVSMISISVYYPFLLSVRVDGSGVNPPRSSICFNASAKTHSCRNQSKHLPVSHSSQVSSIIIGRNCRRELAVEGIGRGCSRSEMG